MIGTRLKLDLRIAGGLGIAAKGGFMHYRQSPTFIDLTPTASEDNVGFRVANHIINKWELEKQGKKFKSFLYTGKFNRHRIFLIKPQTYMNLSGEAVQVIKGFYKIPINKVIVIYDDFDLPLGKIRLRAKGSAGTHNGLKSIINLLHSQEIARLKVGIGPLPDHMSPSSYVLSDFGPEEEESLKDICINSAQALECVIKDGIVSAMNKTN